MKNSLNPPKHLSAAAKTWWRQIQDEYSVTDSAGLLVLEAAMEAFDRMKMAQSQVLRDGLTSSDRFGQAKPHPAVIIERDSRGQMLAALKQLNLDIEPLEGRAGRPAGR